MRILIITSAAHVVGSWYTGGGYASSAVDVYVSGGSTEMFGSVSSGGGYSSPAPPVTKRPVSCGNHSTLDTEYRWAAVHRREQVPLVDPLERERRHRLRVHAVQLDRGRHLDRAPAQI